jgi:protein O-mannosyl-transferase
VFYSAFSHEIMRLKIFICLLLAGVTVAIYWPARHFDYIFDDDLLFLQNEGTGLNWPSLKWAMTSVVVANWHPVTILSFLFTHQFWGMDPGVEHVVNMIFHAANTALLFLVLTQMTGTTWRSAAAAAIFGWHPLRVESVAWIAERKDVLFVFFMLLSLLCYGRYAPGGMKEGRDAGGAARRPCRNIYYVLALMFFALSFMSKAMVVTLPFLLLLLDFWPLGRFSRATTYRLVMEKIPFFALTFFFSGLTFWVQKQNQAVSSLQVLGPMTRLENVTLSYVYYLGHFFWPAKLSLLYEYPEHFNAVEVSLAALLLVAVSALCVLQIPRRPYLAVGWFWYLGTMLPVIGLVQIGIDAMADRYTYLPLIGPTISLVWLAGEWGRTQPARNAVAAGAAVILVACVISTRWQLQFWQNSVKLFDRTIAIAPEYEYPHFPLALGLEEQKRWKEAAAEYQFVLAMKFPWLYHPSHFNFILSLADLHLSDVLGERGFQRQANEYLEATLKVDTNSVPALNNLAWSLATSADASLRNGEQAVALGEQACELTQYKKTIYIGTLAAAYAEAGRFDDAVATAQRAIASAQEHGEKDLAEKNQELLELYLKHRAYHQ